MSVAFRVAAIVRIGLAQLRHEKARTVLAVLGITLAVLAITLLSGIGIGVVETGEQKFDASARDLWVTGGPVKFSPQTGGVENTLVDAHPVAAEIQRRDDVLTAVPMAFQTVYVSTNMSEFKTVIGTGAPAKGKSVRITDGEAFSSEDVHYADGTYDGPMTHEVVISPRTATLLNASVGDTLYVGGTIATARQHEFTVVGISPTFSQFLGAPNVVVHLSELQEITGTTATDRATFISVSLHDGADPERVAAELERRYPGYDVRTNEEQLRATLRDQAVLLVSGASLVVLALLTGVTLTVNLLLSLVYQQRRELAALKALGSSTATLAGIVAVQALVLGVIGGLLGVGLTFPAVSLLNRIASAVVGFEGVVQTTRLVLLGGFGVAVVMGGVGAVAAAIRIGRLSPLKYLS